MLKLLTRYHTGDYYANSNTMRHFTTGNKLDYIIPIQQNSNSNTRKYYIRKNTNNIRCSSGHCTRTYIFSLIYINDLPQYIKHSQIRLFVDDSIIYRPLHTLTDCLKLQTDLEAAMQWERDWLMAFHPDKCNILRVTSKQKIWTFLLQHAWPHSRNSAFS